MAKAGVQLGPNSKVERRRADNLVEAFRMGCHRFRSGLLFSGASVRS